MFFKNKSEHQTERPSLSDVSYDIYLTSIKEMVTAIKDADHSVDEDGDKRASLS